ncbi:MAG: aspartate aminotransferase family protein [Deltaproteobacteria bacterium]|jgi:beta-alanine--pyruvate transaminase|nr:aspartate aminotransferase family protein [Deltaproteobacteria bacterium]
MDQNTPYWLPFTPNRSFKRAPRLLQRAEGMYFWNRAGERLLDGCSGLFCCSLGHGRPEILEAISTQYSELDFGPPFRYGHPGAFELADRLAEITPADLNRIFFVNSGSEAVDSAMKIALLWHRSRGQAQRQRFVSRERAYHGVNFGGVSLSGMPRNRESFGMGLPGTLHLRHTFDEARRFTPGQSEHGAELALDLQRFVDLHGAETIAACFVEPIAGSTGILVPPRGYLERLRAICDEHGILLVFDEVITGFGRTGSPFASDRFGVVPDMITLAKALTNGAVPMGAVAVREGIYEQITSSAPDGAIEFFHGYTYSAHPLACAAGMATQKIYRDEAIFERAAQLEPHFQQRVFELQKHEIVRDIRGLGLLAGIELEPGEKAGARGTLALERFFEEGLVVRVSADTLILAPALVAEPDQLDRICEIVSQVLASL